MDFFIQLSGLNLIDEIYIQYLTKPNVCLVLNFKYFRIDIYKIYYISIRPVVSLDSSKNILDFRCIRCNILTKPVVLLNSPNNILGFRCIISNILTKPIVFWTRQIIF